jgi:hypothetical protein
MPSLPQRSLQQSESAEHVAPSSVHEDAGEQVLVSSHRLLQQSESSPQVAPSALHAGVAPAQVPLLSQRLPVQQSSSVMQGSPSAVQLGPEPWAQVPSVPHTSLQHSESEEQESKSSVQFAGVRQVPSEPQALLQQSESAPQASPSAVQLPTPGPDSTVQAPKSASPKMESAGTIRKKRNFMFSSMCEPSGEARARCVESLGGRRAEKQPRIGESTIATPPSDRTIVAHRTAAALGPAAPWGRFRGWQASTNQR